MIQQDVIWKMHNDCTIQLHHLCSIKSLVGMRIWLHSTLAVLSSQHFFISCPLPDTDRDTFLIGEKINHKTDKTKVNGDKCTGSFRPNCDYCTCLPTFKFCLFVLTTLFLLTRMISWNTFYLNPLLDTWIANTFLTSVVCLSGLLWCHFMRGS